MRNKLAVIEGSITITARGLVNRVAELSVRVWGAPELEPRSSRADGSTVNTVRARKTGLFYDHPLASIGGLLEDHPLRDEYLKALEAE